MPLRGAGKTPTAASSFKGSIATKTQVLAQQTAAELSLLTDADREQLQLEKQGVERNIVADRLFSWNGLISALMLAGSAWVLRYPAATRRGWKALERWSFRLVPGRATNRKA